LELNLVLIGSIGGNWNHALIRDWKLLN
jgi:hypothetical protein